MRQKIPQMKKKTKIASAPLTLAEILEKGELTAFPLQRILRANQHNTRFPSTYSFVRR